MPFDMNDNANFVIILNLTYNILTSNSYILNRNLKEVISSSPPSKTHMNLNVFVNYYDTL